MAADDARRKPVVGMDYNDGTMFIMDNGAAASFFHGAWHPGIPWDGRTIMQYSAVTDRAEIERLMRDAAEALTESLKRPD